MNRRLPPPLWAAIAWLIQHGIAGKRAPIRWSIVAASLCGVLALSLGFGALIIFRRHHTSFSPEDVDHAQVLVTTGPNALSRNPMYLSLGLMLASYAIFRRSLLAFAPVAGLIAVIDRLQIPAEEAALERKFGAEYRDYAARVPRWVRVRPRSQR